MTNPSTGSMLFVFRVMEWLCPAPELDPELLPTPEVLQEKGAWWNWASGLIFLTLMVACAVLFGWAACWIAANRLAPLGNPLYLIRAEPFELCFWVVFFAIVFASWLTFLMLRIVLGSSGYRECMMVLSHNSPLGGSDGFKVHFGKLFGILLLLLGPLLAFFIALRIDSYTAFTEDAMINNSMWSLGRESVHKYQDIRGIYAIAGFHSRFEDVKKPRHAIAFADGTVWASDDGMRAPRPETDEQFLRQVAAKCGKQILAINFLEDVLK